MYHMYILKNDQLPDLIHDHVDLDVHLDPQDGLERLRNHKIQIPHEKLGQLHVYCPGITRIEERILAGDHGVSDDEVLLPPVAETFGDYISKFSQFGDYISKFGQISK